MTGVRKGWLLSTVIAAAVGLFASTTTWAGPIFLTGHDPDFHSQPGSGNGGKLLLTGLNYATGGNAADATRKFLWVEANVGDPLVGASVPFGHLVGEDGLAAIGLTAGIHFDAVNGAQFATLSNADLSNYEAIAVASSYGGMLTRAELDALIARSADIAAFVNAGGGIFASAECDNCGQDLLGLNPNLFGYLPVTVTSIGASAPFHVTGFGAGLGLADGDMNDPTHNSFGLVGGLNVVDTDSAGNATTLAGTVQITGGGGSSGGFISGDVPEPSTLAIFGLGLAGLGFLRRRRRVA